MKYLSYFALTGAALAAIIPSEAFAEPSKTKCIPVLPNVKPVGDAELDARAPEALFRRLEIEGISDDFEPNDSIVAADFNKDGLNDLLLVKGGKQELRLLLNKGCFKFEDANLEIVNSSMTAKKMGRATAIANVADFDGDGWLDIFLTRNLNIRGEEPTGNALLMSKGSFRTYQDVGPNVGIVNREGYNRASSIADFDQDGWLDIVLASDQIGALPIGIAQQRLYNFSTSTDKFEDGRFVDLGGKPEAGGFGGEFKCSRDDKAGPLASLRDLDGDGDLDLVQSYHLDMQRAKVSDPCTPANLSYGIQAWRNQLKETGKFGFALQPNTGFGGLASYRYNETIEDYEPLGEAISMPYLFFGDTDNDGDLDVIGVGPSDPSWRLGSTTISGLFWRNDGDFQFTEATSATGFDPLNWTYKQWSEFWVTETVEVSPMMRAMCEVSWQPRRCRNETGATHRFYGADAAIADYNNDGWLDVVVVDRHESDVNMGAMRNVLFLNNGDGTFSVTKTEVSGLDVNSIAVEASDLNNDGLIDLIAIADPMNSYIRVNDDVPPLPTDRFVSKIFWNTGAQGADNNHWVRLRFNGISHAELIGARVERFDVNGSTMGIRDVTGNQSYKSGGALDVHWGLGKSRNARFKVTLQSGKSLEIRVKTVDRILDVDLTKASH
jgi:hypothetical protein